MTDDKATEIVEMEKPFNAADGFDDEFDDFDELEDESGISAKIEEYLTFRLSRELYGVEVSRVKEVVEYENVFSIPLTPGYIAGVTNLRGDVIPIIDLNNLFYSRKTEITRLSCIVFIETTSEAASDSILIGILIDAIMEVAQLPEDSIEQPPDFGLNIKSEYVKAIGKKSNKFITLLNIERVLDIDDLSYFESADIGK